MDTERIVVIGADAAGMSAAHQALRTAKAAGRSHRGRGARTDAGHVVLGVRHPLLARRRRGQGRRPGRAECPEAPRHGGGSPDRHDRDRCRPGRAHGRLRRPVGRHALARIRPARDRHRSPARGPGVGTRPGRFAVRRGAAGEEPRGRRGLDVAVREAVRCARRDSGSRGDHGRRLPRDRDGRDGAPPRVRRHPADPVEGDGQPGPGHERPHRGGADRGRCRRRRERRGRWGVHRRRLGAERALDRW